MSPLQPQVLVTIVVISTVTPFFLIALIPIAYLYFRSQQYYVRTSRALKRLESVSRSPLYAQFGETNEGIVTIRCDTHAPARRGARGTAPAPRADPVVAAPRAAPTTRRSASGA